MKWLHIWPDWGFIRWVSVLLAYVLESQLQHPQKCLWGWPGRRLVILDVQWVLCLCVRLWKSTCLPGKQASMSMEWWLETRWEAPTDQKKLCRATACNFHTSSFFGVTAKVDLTCLAVSSKLDPLHRVCTGACLVQTVQVAGQAS